ncbi:MAG TPA: lamin tail domain-containing protein [Kofleriaceae bacterium]|nr:lamin tail domain-containing protein [Kofleriaceae bacterium]
MQRLALLLAVVAACSDDGRPANPMDAGVDAPVTPIDGSPDATPDAPIDAPPDAPLTPAELIVAARAAADGAAALSIRDATITYIKPAVTGASLTNDPPGFTIQATASGPALMIEADVSLLDPAPAVGDVVSFTIGEMKTAGMSRHGAAITAYARSQTGTDVTALAQDVGAATDLVSAVGDYESELVSATVTIVESWGTSGSSFSRARVTTTGIPTLDNNLQLRLPTTFKDSLGYEVGCVVRVTNTPLNRFNTQAQLSAFVAADLTLVSCPAPTVSAAAAPAATTVTVTFSRALDTASVLADGTQFTIDNGLTVSAASASGNLVTLTTSAQTPGTTYTVSVANTVEDTFGTALGAPATAMFTGFMPVVAANHLVLNEVDYDQASTDASSFIEIYNPTNAAIPLANFTVVYVNGGSTGGPTGTVYGTPVALSTAGTELAAGGYLVIRNTAVTIPGGVLSIDVGTGDFLQNGADGIALIDTDTNTLVDALHYASPANGVGAGITMATISGFAATVSLVEGTVFATADTQTGSLARTPNGKDTDNASADWALATTPTPGAAN